MTIKTVNFGSQPYLNKNKEQYIRQMYSEQINFQQSISNYVFEHFDEYLNDLNSFSSKTIQNELYKQIETNYLQQWSKQKLQSFVIDKYKNKLKQLNKKLKFNVVKEYSKEYYKIGKKRGQIKSFKPIYKKSNFIQFLNYLVKINFKDLEHFNNVIKLIQNKKKSFLQSYLFIKKHNLEVRIFNLVISKRNRFFKKYFYKPVIINNTSIPLNPMKKSRLIIDKENKLLQHFLIINKKLKIPITINDNYKYHNKIKDLNWNNIKIRINKNNKIVIHTSIKEQDKFQDFKHQNYQSIDVNFKHNIFIISIFNKEYQLIETKSYNLDGKWLQENILNKLKVLENKGYQNLNNIELKLLKHLENLFTFELRKLISKQIKWLQQNNVNFIIMENLNLSQTKNGKRHYQDKTSIFKGYNINKLVRLFHLSSIKYYFKQQQENRNIKVEFVEQKYTSQRCPVCGTIDKRNRPNQETFKCVNCGYKNNQDINQTINIFVKGIQKVFGFKQNNLIVSNNDILIVKFRDEVSSLLSSSSKYKKYLVNFNDN